MKTENKKKYKVILPYQYYYDIPVGKVLYFKKLKSFFKVTLLEITTIDGVKHFSGCLNCDFDKTCYTDYRICCSSLTRKDRKAVYLKKISKTI